MEAQNPYQPPQAQVIDAGSDAQAVKLTLKQIWFSFEGRISRKVFWLYGLLLAVPLGVLWGIAAAISDTLNVVVAIPMNIAFVWMALAMQVKRWHDRDKSGWWILLGFVPIANIWAFIETGFLRGTEGANQYGGDATELY